MAMALSEEFEFLQKRITMLQYQVLQCHQGLAKVSGEMEEVAARLQAAAALASKVINSLLKLKFLFTCISRIDSHSVDTIQPSELGT